MRMGSEEVISYDTKPAGDVVPTPPLQSCFNVGYNSTKNTLLFFRSSTIFHTTISFLTLQDCTIIL